MRTIHRLKLRGSLPCLLPCRCIVHDGCVALCSFFSEIEVDYRQEVWIHDWLSLVSVRVVKSGGNTVLAYREMDKSSTKWFAGSIPVLDVC